MNIRNVSAAMLAIVIFSCLPALSQSEDIQSRTIGFLEAYMRDDSATVLRSIDKDTIVYGSDIAEVFRGRQEIDQMLRDDARLWGGKARLGEPKDVTVYKQKALTTIFFNTTFTLGDRAPIPVRFCFVWRRSGDHWMLVQEANAVVTTGQSARALLGTAGH